MDLDDDLSDDMVLGHFSLGSSSTGGALYSSIIFSSWSSAGLDWVDRLLSDLELEMS